MKPSIILTFLTLFFLFANLPAQESPQARIVSRLELPSDFYQEGDDDLQAVALTPDGSYVAMLQAASIPGAEGRMFDLKKKTSRVFWKTGDLRSGDLVWYREGGMIRVSGNGLYAGFPVFLGTADGKPVDPWGAALAVDFVPCVCPTQLFDLKDFLVRQDPAIDGARGIQDVDMNGEGNAIYAVVPYHRKGDGEALRTAPNRRALIEIRPMEKKMTLVATAARGERYYPFLGLSTDRWGSAFVFKGAAEDGQTMVTYLCEQNGGAVSVFTPVLKEVFSGVTAGTGQGGPFLVTGNDIFRTFIFPKADGPVIAYDWQSHKSFQYGTSEKDGLLAPVTVGSRFVSGDGGHLFYRGKSDFVWYPLAGKPCRFAPAEGNGWLQIPGHNNNFISADGSLVLLQRTEGSARRLVVYGVAAP
jgi:hypothetical protein